MTADDLAHDAHAEARRNRVAKWAWVTIGFPIVTVCFVVMNFETFVKVFTLVTVYLSLTAMSVGHHAAEKGAESKAAGYENP